MEKSLNLRFKYTEKEYAEAVKLYYLNSLNIKIDIIISVILIFFWEFLLDHRK